MFYVVFFISIFLEAVIMQKSIDISKWQRKEIFEFFSTISNPYYMVTFRQDVTKLYEYVKKNGLSFYYSLIYLCTKAINEIKAFKYVIRDERVFCLDSRIPSFTDLKKESECFHIVTMPLVGSISDFNKDAKEKSCNQENFIDLTFEGDNLIYFSCLPWVDVTAITNERDLALKNAREDSIPHIAWGKYVRENNLIKLGISLEVNHRLIDGIHIGMFASKLDELINDLE